jgi:ribosome biogenesis GTPase
VGREIQQTGEVRSGDFKGKHTTTARELVPLSKRTNGGKSRNRKR